MIKGQNEFALSRIGFASAVTDAATSVAAFCLFNPCVCQQTGTAAEAPAPVVRNIVRFIDVMCAVEMREVHLEILLWVCCFLSLSVLYTISFSLSMILFIFL